MDWMDTISEASSCVFVLMMEIVEAGFWKEGKRVKLEQNRKMEIVFEDDSCRKIVDEFEEGIVEESHLLEVEGWRV